MRKKIVIFITAVMSVAQFCVPFVSAEERGLIAEWSGDTLSISYGSNRIGIWNHVRKYQLAPFHAAVLGQDGAFEMIDGRGDRKVYSSAGSVQEFELGLRTVAYLTTSQRLFAFKNDGNRIGYWEQVVRFGVSARYFVFLNSSHQLFAYRSSGDRINYWSDVEDFQLDSWSFHMKRNGQWTSVPISD